MNVLVACEESQRVCCAFRSKGHNAFSVDILDCSGGHPEWHIKGDVTCLLDGEIIFQTQDGDWHWIPEQWDLIIAFPPCTYLSNVGSVRLRPGGVLNQDRFEKSILAREFFLRILNARCDRICIENPTPGSIHNLPLYSQVIEPFMFGDPWKKRTCLWLKNLPILMATDIVIPLGHWVYGCSSDRSEVLVGKSSAKLRSKTFPGVAAAMADQWNFD